MTGRWMLLGLAALAATAGAMFLRGLLRELSLRRSLPARSPGVVHDVEFSRAGRPEGQQRATVSFTDTHGQTRRVVTSWAEFRFSQGQAVTVAYDPVRRATPHVLRASVLIQSAAFLLVSAAIVVAVLAVVVRSR